MQNAVYIYCAIKHHEIIVPNSCLFGWEADVVSVTKAGLASEFEIKVSRSDFRADAKKAHRGLLTNPVQKSSWTERVFIHPRPNYFYYVVPDGLILPEEVPDYAGLIYVHKKVTSNALYYTIASAAKPARKLHRERVTDDQRRQLARAMTFRFWRQRLGTDRTEEGGITSTDDE